MTLTFIIIAVSILWFIFLWTLVISLLSIVSGWNKLSRKYPVQLSLYDEHSAVFSPCSIRMGFVNYNNIVYISFTGSGIILKILKIFSFMHKPVFIPYEAISEPGRGRVIFAFTEFKVDGKKICIYGKPGEDLFSRLSGTVKK